MRIKPSKEWWKPPELQLESRISKWFVMHSDIITVIIALTAVIVGLLTVVTAPWLWPIRLSLSFITLLFAYLSTGRVNILYSHAEDAEMATARVRRECPECGESLGFDEPPCMECGWE
jgi:hypothetical protein